MRVAITGGIAEGKSTVLAMLAELGATTASADAVSREIWPDPAIQAELAAVTGLSAPLDRDALRNLIAADERVRRAVNQVMHPRIRHRMVAIGADFDEIPLLVETVAFDAYDESWLVTCDPSEQYRRLRARYGESADIERILATQLPSRAKVPFVNRIIRTDGDLQSVKHLVQEGYLDVLRRQLARSD